jgi:hypothetical protein
MKKLTYILLILSCLSLNAQNLIPNGDFELGPDSSSNGWTDGFDSVCNLVGVVLGPDFWVIDENTPDRLIEGDIPCNWDNDTAQSGKAYVIFGYAEAGKANLISHLQKDSLYRLKYCISLETFRGFFIQPFHIEFIFNNGGDTIPSVYANYPSQWLCYDTLFIASANSTEIKIRGIDFVNSGVKIDNISLTKESSTGINAVKNIKEELIVFPNPASKKFIIKTTSRKFNLEIYNSLGIIVKQLNNTSLNEIDVSDFTAGIYFIKASFSNQIIIQKLIINN